MSELKDPKIKLFGRTIELPESIGPVSSSLMLEADDLNVNKEQESVKSASDRKEGDEAKAENPSIPKVSQDVEDPGMTSQHFAEERSTAPENDKTESPKTSKTEDGQNETSNSHDKTPKKPDKILACPRCNSMDTKFCYFNNYNVNQPRHFCKNCQRYWTAGGSMRNVPVGAGRRKNKNSVSQFRHVAVPEAAIQGARVDLPNGIHHPILNPNGTVLSFSPDAPLCKSMATVLNITDESMKKSPRNGFHKPDELGDNASRSAMSGTSSDHETGPSGLPEFTSNHHPFPSQVPCWPGTPWPYPWSSVPWNPSLPPNTTFMPTNFHVPFYPSSPPPYWPCSVPGTWNVPWITPPNASQPSTCSGINSPTLGKHSRDNATVMPDNFEEGKPIKESDTKQKSLWVPKTLRIDDPEEAAKSSIWVTLGIKKDNSADSVGGSRVFKAFQGQQQSKSDEKTTCVSETSTVLQANPAALSRSLSFHESS